MVSFHDHVEACVSWRVLPLVLLEGCLEVVILWRIGHQVYWKSHPRRIFFHLVLFVSCAFRWVHWLALCRPSMLSIGLALLWWSNSLILLCTASIILQWSTAVSAGRVATRELQRTKRFSLLHPLVFLHTIHLACAIGGGVDAISRDMDSKDEIEGYLKRSSAFLTAFRIVNAVTVAIDGVMAIIVSRKLRERFMSAAISDEMKKKSVIQMILLIVLITVSLLIELVMDLPVIIQGFDDAFGNLSFLHFTIIKFFVPGMLLSLAFLYIMRRVEQRDPVRLVVMPTVSSLVEFEECRESPCMWCEHHRRFHTDQNKWDVTFMTSFSPRSGEATFRSMIAGSNGLLITARNSGGGPGSTFPADLEVPITWTASQDDLPRSPFVPPHHSNRNQRHGSRHPRHHRRERQGEVMI